VSYYCDKKGAFRCVDCVTVFIAHWCLKELKVLP
jgi:hypothetical protein